jgi:hypothetical protein
MMKAIGIVSGLFLGSCMLLGQNALAQNPNGGTVNSMSTDPQQNQKMTGTMGTTTGQPNDVTPGSGAADALGNPTTRTMTGSDSNGNYHQTPAKNQQNSKKQEKTTKKPAAKKSNTAPQP